MPDRSRKRPRDLNRLAASAVQAATESETSLPEANEGKNPAAVALGRLGGKKGGPARAARLSAEQRTEIARRAAQARWESRKSPKKIVPKP